MATVTKMNAGVRIDLQLKAWEVAALVTSGLVFGAMTFALITDFSVRRILWPSAGEGHLARPIGKVTYTLNKALRQGLDQPEFVNLSQNDPVYPLDTIMAGPGAALKITLEDNSVIEVGENSMIRLNFDSRLRLSGLNRETVVEVVAGTVAAKGSDSAQIRIKSENRTFLATQEKPLELSRHGGEIATTEGSGVDLVAQAKQAETKRLNEARVTFAKMGGVMTAAPGGGGGAKAVSISEIYSGMKQKNAPTGKAAPLAVGTQGNEMLQHERVALATKETEDMMSQVGSSSQVKTKTELAKIRRIQPDDNFMVKTQQKGMTDLVFPIELTWTSEPEDAPFTVRISQKGRPDDLVKIQARDGDAKLTYNLKRAGDYTWRIEDRGGAVLSVRSFHVNSHFQAIQLYEPVLIGRERGSKMWGAQDKWGLLFKWKGVKGVTSYKIRITRNVDGTAANNAGVVAEHVTKDAEFILPFNKEWQAERMFFAVEGTHSDGFQLASNHVPFMFTFLPPKPRAPKNGNILARDRLTEGAVNLNWDADSQTPRFTLEIATDPQFKDKIENEHLDENLYRFYPPSSGKYYWRIRGDKDDISSPFSETWEFSVK